MLKPSVITITGYEVPEYVNKGTFKFDNQIQRSYVWEKERRSELIHTMIEGYPVIPFYAKKIPCKGYTNYDFLDGKQRMLSIAGYINGEYALEGISSVEIDGESVDINGLYFSQLPDKIRRRIEAYSLTIHCYDDLSSTEERIMFKKLNNGKPLTNKERNIANCTDLDNISQFCDHPFFAVALSEKSLQGRKQIPIIMKALAVLNNDLEAISFESKVFNDVITSTNTTEAQRREIKGVLDFSMRVYKSFRDSEKMAKRKFCSETHFVSLVPYMRRAINDGISADMFAAFVHFSYRYRTPVSERYAAMCRASSAKNSSIRGRNEELEKKWQEFFKVDEEETAKETEVVEEPEFEEKDETVEEVEAVEEVETVDGIEVVEETEMEVVEESENSEVTIAIETDKPSREEVLLSCLNEDGDDNEEEEEELYYYGMKFRPFSPGNQPTKGFIRVVDGCPDEFHDVIVYDRELSKEELDSYELVPLEIEDEDLLYLPFC